MKTLLTMRCPSPNTIFKDVFKVNPGEIVSFEYKIDGISIHKEKILGSKNIYK